MESRNKPHRTRTLLFACCALVVSLAPLTAFEHGSFFVGAHVPLTFNMNIAGDVGGVWPGFGYGGNITFGYEYGIAHLALGTTLSVGMQNDVFFLPSSKYTSGTRVTLVNVGVKFAQILYITESVFVGAGFTFRFTADGTYGTNGAPELLTDSMKGGDIYADLSGGYLIHLSERLFLPLMGTLSIGLTVPEATPVAFSVSAGIDFALPF